VSPSANRSSTPLRVVVRVRPGSSRTSVGGRHGEAEPPVLLVRVTAPPVDGRANAAVCRALADAFGVRTSAVSLVSGAAARTKVLEIAGGDPVRLRALLRS